MARVIVFHACRLADLELFLSLGSKYKVEKVFADDGSIVSGATTSAPYKNKLILTGEQPSLRCRGHTDTMLRIPGVMTSEVVVCEIPK